MSEVPTSPDGKPALADRAILVVEDEYMIAADLRHDLTAVGSRVVGPAPSLDRAMELVARAPRLDGAILDINLGGEMVYPLADALRARHVPFMFATGYDGSIIPSRFADVPRCEKPASFERIRDGLAAIIAAGPA